MFLLNHITVTHFQTWCKKKRNFLHFYPNSYYEQQPMLWFKSANKISSYIDFMSYKTPKYNIFTAKLKKSVISGHGNETKNVSPVRSQTLTGTQLKKHLVCSCVDSTWRRHWKSTNRQPGDSAQLLSKPHDLSTLRTTDTPKPFPKMNSSSWYLAQKTDYITPNQNRQRLSFGLTHYTGSRPRRRDKTNNIQETQHSWRQINMYCVLKNPWISKTWTRAGLISFLHLKNK